MIAARYGGKINSMKDPRDGANRPGAWSIPSRGTDMSETTQHRNRRLARNRWNAMKRRCIDPTAHNWRWYGGRGIRVCDEWQASFDAYYDYVGDRPPGLTLDRIDNDGNYEPGNVRWATGREQMLNKRDYNRSKTCCPQGHPYDEANTYLDKRNRRSCKACGVLAASRYRERRKH